MEYRLVKEVANKTPERGKWPFLKRKAFEDEREYRIIYESSTERLQSKQVSIKLSCIRKVTLSPWLPESVADAVIDVIRGIKGCEGLLVNRSSLIDNSGWKKAID
jgi:hypothetical protein